jgi:glycosyltransferase involved in cell wall biosynthesis
MYHYLHAGLAILVGNFPDLHEIAERQGCGVVVDLKMPSKIEEALDFLVENSEILNSM